MGKNSIMKVVSDYFSTLRDSRTNVTSLRDITIQIALPFTISIVYGVLRWFGLVPTGDGSVSANIITIVSIVSALLCGAAVMVFQLRFDIIDTRLQDFVREDELVLIDEIYADMLWAIAEGLVVACLLTARGVCCVPQVDCMLASFALGLFVNFIFVLMMCLKRMSVAYEFVSKYWSRMKSK